MKVIEAGRVRFPEQSVAARRYAERNLVSIHGRLARLSGLVRGARVRGRAEEAEEHALPPELGRWSAGMDDWLMLRDYAEASRGRRTIVFFFRRGSCEPSLVIKTREAGAAGPSLLDEGVALKSIADRLPRVLRSALPVVHEIAREGEREFLVLSAIPGTPLSIRMQRALRPRRSHAASLIAAGAWLGAFHAATRSGETTAVHGDFWPRNLLFGPGAHLAGVVDWERASLSGRPWPDVFRLPILFVAEAPGWREVDRRRELLRAFAGRGPLNRIVRAYFHAYSGAAGVPLERIGAEFERELALGIEPRLGGDAVSRVPSFLRESH